MNHGLDKVRNAIKERKKRKINETNRKREYSFPYVLSDEEKYGFYSLPVYEIEEKKRKSPRTFRVYPTAFKLFLSCLLFIGSAIMLKANVSDKLAPLEKIVYDMHEVEFPFAKVYDWYVTTFGAPFAFEEPIDETTTEATLPIGGHVVETFAINGKGILISPEQQEHVLAVNRGIVIFRGNDRHTNKTVVIQHPDGTNSTYGHLTSIDVHLYEKVDASSPIGTFNPVEENELFYFAIEKGQEYVNPAKVIPVDDVR